MKSVLSENQVQRWIDGSVGRCWAWLGLPLCMAACCIAAFWTAADSALAAGFEPGKCSSGLRLQDDGDTEQEDGQADLEQALEKSAKAETTRDLDAVVRLLDSALAKELDDESRKVALNLLKATLINHVEELGSLIFAQPRDVRWQFYRRQALKKLERLTEMDQPPFEAFVMVARLNSLPNGDREQGREAIEKAMEIAKAEDKDTAELKLLGAMLIEDAEERLAELSKVLEEDPENVSALEMRAQMHAGNGDVDKAVEDLKAIVKLQPDNLPVMQTLLQIYMQKEEFESAAGVLQMMADNDPAEPRFLLALAQLRIDLEQFEKAIAPLDRALELDGSLLGAISMRAVALLSTEKYQLALEDIEVLLEAEPEDIRTRLFRAIALSELERYDEAVEDFDFVIDAVPTEQSFKLQKARCLMRAGKLEAAEEIYSKLLERRQRNTDVYRSRGDAFLAIGEHAQAIADYDRGLEIDEEDSGILNNLAWLLSTSPFEDVRDGKRAVELATKACELTEFAEAHILSTLASSYAEADDFENALKWGKKAVECGEETGSTQLDDLKRELVAYEANKKWREYLEVSGPEGEVEFELPDREQAEAGESDQGADKEAQGDAGDDSGDGGGR